MKTVLAHVSSRTPESVRWNELTLESLPSGRFILTDRGRSIVYHRLDGVCRKGELVQISDITDELYAELVPCETCSPQDLDDLDPASFIRREVTIMKEKKFTNAALILPILRREDPVSHVLYFTQLARDLISIARTVNDDVNRAASRNSLISSVHDDAVGASQLTA